MWSLCICVLLCYPYRYNEGVIVKVVRDIPNPYRNQGDFDMRFMFTLNKIYVWSLTAYERVVMLDADNLFLRKSDELFQCGQFCAVFINPCIFHTGLFVLEVSYLVFFTQLRHLRSKRLLLRLIFFVVHLLLRKSGMMLSVLGSRKPFSFHACQLHIYLSLESKDTSG